MSCIKRFIEDVCYLYRDGFTAEEISKKYGVSVEMVNETINEYYDKLIY